MDLCNGKGCPRKEECQRYIAYTFKRKPFVLTLCEYDRFSHFDYFIEIEQIEAEVVDG
jgi:uncharacterized Fe-S cluster-containing radical SAM superfamily enzyme